MPAVTTTLIHIMHAHLCRYKVYYIILIQATFKLKLQFRNERVLSIFSIIITMINNRGDHALPITILYLYYTELPTV